MFASGLEQSHVPVLRLCRLFLVQRQQTVSFIVWTSLPGNEVDSVPFPPYRTDIVPVLPQVPLQEAATATEYTLAIIVGILGGVLVLLGSLWFCRKRASVTRNVDDVLAALHKTVSGSSASNVKDLIDLDPQIKFFISDSDTSTRACEEILGIVSEHISTLGPVVQVRLECWRASLIESYHNHPAAPVVFVGFQQLGRWRAPEIECISR